MFLKMKLIVIFLHVEAISSLISLLLDWSDHLFWLLDILHRLIFLAIISRHLIPSQHKRKLVFDIVKFELGTGRVEIGGDEACSIRRVGLFDVLELKS